MSHSPLSRASLTAAAEAAGRSTSNLETSSAAVPATVPARPLDAVMLAIHADAARDAADYLKATRVPFGGE